MAVLFSGLWKVLRNLLFGLLSPANFVKVLIVTASTVLSNYLKAEGGAEGIPAEVLKAAAFLTYAGGGITANPSAFISGIFGKTLCASFLVNLLSGKFKGVARGLKMTGGSLFGSYARPSKALVGMGLSLLFYAWAAGRAGLAGSMVGLSAAMLALKAIGGCPGFTRQLFAALNSRRQGEKRRTDLSNMNAMLSGSAAGFALAPSAAIFFKSGILIIGLLLLGLGFVFGFTGRRQRKEALLMLRKKSPAKTFLSGILPGAKKIAAIAAVFFLSCFSFTPMVFAGSSCYKIKQLPLGGKLNSGKSELNYRSISTNQALSWSGGGGSPNFHLTGAWEQSEDGEHALYIRLYSDIHYSSGIDFSGKAHMDAEGPITANVSAFYYNSGSLVWDNATDNFFSRAESGTSYIGSNSDPEIALSHRHRTAVDGILLLSYFSNGAGDSVEIHYIMGDVPEEDLDYNCPFDIGSNQYQEVSEEEEEEEEEENSLAAASETAKAERSEASSVRDESRSQEHQPGLLPPSKDRENSRDSGKQPASALHDILDDLALWDSADSMSEGSYDDGFWDFTPEEAAIVSAVVGAVTVGIAAGAATVSGQSDGSGGPNSGPDGGPGRLTITDPVSGTEFNFNYDASVGGWISDDGRDMLDESRLDEWLKERQQEKEEDDAKWRQQQEADRRWADEQFNKISRRDSDADRDADRKARERKAVDAQIDAEEQRAAKGHKFGIYSGDEEAIKRAMRYQQNLNELEQNKAQRELAWQENKLEIAQLSQKAADYGVEILGEVTGPTGKYVVKNVYYGGRNLASNLSEVYNSNKKDKSYSFALAKALGETVVDVAQNSVQSRGYKFLANAGGDAFKAGLDAYDKGSSVSSAMSAGFATGATKFVAGEAMDKYVTSAHTQSSGVFTGKNLNAAQNNSLMNRHVHQTLSKINNIRNAVSSGQVSEACAKGAITVIRENAALASKFIKGGAAAGNTFVGNSLDEIGKAVSGRNIGD